MCHKGLCYVFVLGVLFCVTSCAPKKIVARNCEKAGNAELYVCDTL